MISEMNVFFLNKCALPNIFPPVHLIVMLFLMHLLHLHFHLPRLVLETWFIGMYSNVQILECLTDVDAPHHYCRE
jgi:hypothetical protein